MNASSRVLVTMSAALALSTGAAQAQLLISGNDEKQTWDEAGKAVLSAPGKDSLSIIDIRDRAHPRVVASLSLMNSVVGPPTNLAITPDGKLALVANSLDWVQGEGGGWKTQPDDKLFVIDLTASPPAILGTVTVGKQPSGLAISRAGDLALVANRADNTVSVLAIDGNDVKVVDVVALAAAGAPSEQVSSVAITPDGKRALVSKFATHKVALLEIDGRKVTYGKYDMAVGLWPYNVQITSDGKLGLAGNSGAMGASDGQVDTVAVIDLEATPPRVVDQVVVGDGPEGLAVSPRGGYAAVVILNGTGNVPRKAFFATDHAYVSLLEIRGKKVRKVAEAKVGGLAEGVAFSPDGHYLYVGNFLDGDLTVLQLKSGKLVKVGSLKLPGHPASLRGATP
ncbi:MAG TPA: YncE family protein [Anaeromyxobacteraceae bacterium]|nr:YncE family protein [Anaeromyxobacteraceae bacterium]